MKICYCRKCRTLDYAEGICSKCGSTELDETDVEFLIFCRNVIRQPIMSELRNPLIP